jgi:hypothetical protein
MGASYVNIFAAVPITDACWTATLQNAPPPVPGTIISAVCELQDTVVPKNSPICPESVMSSTPKFNPLIVALRPTDDAMFVSAI